jgi:hypothetical protein
MLELARVYSRLRRVNSAARLQAVHRQPGLPAHQPIAGRHGGAIVEHRSVPNDDRAALVIAQHDLKRTSRLSTQQRPQVVSVLVVLPVQGSQGHWNFHARLLTFKLIASPAHRSFQISSEEYQAVCLDGGGAAG